jgi:hypothetical protein
MDFWLSQLLKILLIQLSTSYIDIAYAPTNKSTPFMSFVSTSILTSPYQNSSKVI